MLRALTSYFFGGIQDETPEAAIECETREVNDWLVVNLPDQIKDTINLNEDDDACEIDEGDIRNEIDEDDVVEVESSYVDEMDEEEDEEDVYMSLSLLLMPPESSSELSDDQYSFENLAEQQQMVAEYFSMIEGPQWPFANIDSKQLMQRDRISHYLNYFPAQPAIPRICERDSIESEALHNYFAGCRIDKHRLRNDIVSVYERVHAQAIDLAPPPMYSKSYVNHRHPEKLLNHDILQRIKELEPEQQAVQRSAKKLLTRGQLNRQNKNYMYETSSKKNRRSNRQRNHSGANNNRKC